MLARPTHFRRALLLRSIVQPPHRARFSTVRYLFRKAFGGVFAIGGVIGTLTAGGYAVYYFSGLKTVIDTVKPAMAYLASSRENLENKAPMQALQHLQQAAKAYVASVPFAGYLLDKTFNTVQDTVYQHKQQATAVISRAYDDILEIIQRDGNEHTTQGAYEIVKVARQLVKELGALGVKASHPFTEKLEVDKHAAAVSSAVTLAVEDIKSKAASTNIGASVNSAVGDVKSKVTPHATPILLCVKDKVTQLDFLKDRNTADSPSKPIEDVFQVEKAKKD